MQEVRFEIVGPQDGFELALRRQGWHLTGYKPVYADPQVIRPQPVGPWEDLQVVVSSFYAAFGDNTVRKLVRAVLTKPRTREALAHICGDEDKLDKTLKYLEWCRIVVSDGETWSKGPACNGIDNTGQTLEWYVAEWFRHELQVPARHGVTVEEVLRGGDLDVVAVVNDIRVFVECKTSRPDNISESNIRWFLQRAHEFNPEIAVFLVDTTSSIRQAVRLVAEVIGELQWLETHLGSTDVPEGVRQSVGIADVLPGYKELYCCARNVFLVGVPKSIDSSLSAVLRLYHSHVRHQLILPIPREWDFVDRAIQGVPGNPFGVEGEVRLTFPS